MQKSDVVGVWVALWQGLGSVMVPQALSELEQILVLMHCSVAAQMESKCHFRLPLQGCLWLVAVSGNTAVLMLLGFLDGAIFVTLRDIVLVHEGLQSICLTQGRHTNVSFKTYFNFLMTLLLCDPSLCTSYRG